MTELEKLRKALRQIAEVEPTPLNTLAWDLVRIAREATASNRRDDGEAKR
jgi:hypothetical protein